MDIILITLLIVAAVVLGLLPSLVASSRKHANATAITVCCLVGLVIWPAWLVALIWAFTGPNNAQLQKQQRLQHVLRAAPDTNRRRYNEETADEALARMTAPSEKTPRRYRVDGIDRASKMETTAFYEASTEANARAKADLDGVVVTACTEEHDIP